MGRSAPPFTRNARTALFNYLAHNARWLALSYLLWGIGEGLWFYIQPLYLSELGADPAQIGLVMSVMGLVRVVVNLPAGWLADRFGARAVMLPGWLVGVIGVIGIAFAPDWRWLVPAFAFYGLSGCAVPVSAVYLNRVTELEKDTHPRQTFSRALTTTFAAYSAGQIVSPALGGLLGDSIGLRGVFIFSAGWFVLSYLAALRTRPVPPAARQPGPGYRGLLRQPWLMMALVPIGATFAVVALAFPPTSLTPKFMQDVRGLELGVIGVLGSVNALGITLLNLALGRGSRPLRAFMVALALVWMAAAAFVLSGNLLVVGAAYLIVGSAMAARPLIQSAIAPRVRADRRGLVLAVIESVYSLGTAVGTWSAGLLYNGVGPAAPYQVVLIALPVVGALAWLALRAPDRLRTLARQTA